MAFFLKTPHRNEHSVLERRLFILEAFFFHLHELARSLRARMLPPIGRIIGLLFFNYVNNFLSVHNIQLSIILRLCCPIWQPLITIL